MPIAARWRRLERLPAARGRDAMPGVYELADAQRRVIYIGQSGRDVPTRIRQHLNAGGCIEERAVFWRMSQSRVPKAEEAEAIAAHRARYGDLPLCNHATPRRRDALCRWSERSRSK